jgi:hypothetical protein
MHTLQQWSIRITAKIHPENEVNWILQVCLILSFVRGLGLWAALF